MVKWSHYEQRKQRTEEKTNSQKPGKNCRADSRGRANKQCRSSLSAGGNPPGPVLEVEKQVQGRGRGSDKKLSTARAEVRSQNGQTSKRKRKTQRSLLRRLDRTSVTQKKRDLGLEGSLLNRHLSKEIREALIESINEARAKGETLDAICNVLQMNSRAYYRWLKKPPKQLRGGGGKNKIKPLEEKRIIALAKNNPSFRCRRIAYNLEQKSTVFVGKSTVAILLKKHGINHLFERKKPHPQVIPGDELLHEPWAKNLLWGTDWTWVNVDGKFMFLLVVLDWYSRKIISWGLFHQITSSEVISVITDAVAIEGIEKLPVCALRPRIVADHGSANISKMTRANLEIQGLDLWLAGIGRPTGNARTERVIGTLKAEEINLQREYKSEEEAQQRIAAAIEDYNFRRPNAGNGGFAPNAVHHLGRHQLTEDRKRARQKAEEKRRMFWTEESGCIEA